MPFYFSISRLYFHRLIFCYETALYKRRCFIANNQYRKIPLISPGLIQLVRSFEGAYHGKEGEEEDS